MAYVVQSSLCWLVLYGFYGLFLRRQTFFRYNRAYLLLGLLAGLCLPLLSQYLQGHPASASLVAELPVVYIGWVEPVIFAETGSAMPPTFSVKRIIWAIYLMGVGLFMLRTIGGLVQLWRLARQGKRRVYDGYTLCEVASMGSPFSFFKLIFWPTRIRLNSKEGRAIFAHEQAHIRLGHSYDLLMVELLGVLFWFNPIIYIYKKSLRDVHEYQADAAVLEQVPIRPYGQMLLYQARYNSASLLPMGNYFFTKQIKERIMMMTKQPSSKRNLWIYLMAIPSLIMMGMLSFQTEVTAEIPGKVIEMEQEPDEMPIFAGCEGEMDQEARKNCSFEQLIAYVSKHLEYPATAKNAGKEGMAVVAFTVAADGSVEEVSLVTDPGLGMGAEAMRVVNSMPKWNPAKKDGLPISVEMKLPIQFKLAEAEKKNASQGVDQLPIFPGCDLSLDGEERIKCSNNKMIQFISKHLVYPNEAAKNGIEGMVLVSFMVEKDGSVSEVKSLKEIGGGCDEEVMRVVYSMPDWEPGLKEGVPVRTEMKLPVRFVAAQAKEMSQKPIQYDLKLDNYRLAPNPVRDQVEINFKGQEGDLQIRIIDTNGKVLFQEASNQFNGFYHKQVDLSKAAKGLYFLQIRQNGQAFIDRFSILD